MQTITERAAAVIGNLSTSQQFFSAIRESGGLQQLVALLDSGSESRVTEIAAKTLANVAGNEINRKGIRLAGGLPPLINLLTQRPTAQVALCLACTYAPISTARSAECCKATQPLQVLLATEEALRRLEVTNDERNAVLEALRYCAQRPRSDNPSTQASIASSELSKTTSSNATDNIRPFAQYVTVAYEAVFESQPAKGGSSDMQLIPA